VEPYEYKGYTIKPNVSAGDGANEGRWQFETATILDADGNEVNVAAPADDTPHYFDTEDQAARVCISQAKALIEAGDIE
jgi:hypothetical protein